jgi:pimeloyl-ACP methyl ester carboxylesterase
MDPAGGVSAFEHIVSFDAAGSLDRLSFPLRAINGTRVPTDEAANRRHAASFDVTYMENVGHWPMLETPQAFEANLLATVDALAGTDGGEDHE